MPNIETLIWTQRKQSILEALMSECGDEFAGPELTALRREMSRLVGKTLVEKPF